MKNNKSNRARYFRKQKILGGVLALLGILSAFLLEGDITAALLMTPIGICIMFTKDMVLYDDYYWSQQAIHKHDEDEL